MLHSSFFTLHLKLLLCRHIRYNLPVHGIDSSTADVTLKYACHINHWQLGGIGFIKFLHHLVHTVMFGKNGSRLHHQLTHGEMLIQFGAEDNVANLRNIYYSQQHTRLIQNRQKVVVTATYLTHQLAHRQIRTYRMIVFLNDILHAQQGERSLVNMVGEQLALSSQTQGVDAVTLEDADGEERRDTHYHQRHEELVAAREFGNEEDARKRCMHHARNGPPSPSV